MVGERCGLLRYLGLGDRQEAVNEIGHHFKRLTLLFDQSYRHHVGPSNIPIAVEPQHCRQWFAQIAVGSSQQGVLRATGGFGSIARSAQCDGEPFHACQIVLASFAGTGLSPWCRSGSQLRSLQRRGWRVKLSRAGGRIDGVCRQWRSTDVFREILVKLGLAMRCRGNQCFARCPTDG